MEQLSHELEPDLTPPGLQPEHQTEYDRIRSGLSALQLLDHEASNQQFLNDTRLDSGTRVDILNGPSYKGDAVKLQRAITKARSSLTPYRRGALRRAVQVEFAQYLGYEAQIENNQVEVFASAQDQAKFALAHGVFIRDYASPQRTPARRDFRDRLKARLGALSGETLAQPTKSTAETPTVVVIGPSVNLEFRAKHLLAVIRAMAHRSMLSGFDVASNTPRHELPIYERYGDGTPRVKVLANNKRERLLDFAKRGFWVASGFPMLRNADPELMPTREFRPRSRKMWEDFTANFEHPPHQKDRLRFRKQLKKQLPEDINISGQPDKTVA